MTTEPPAGAGSLRILRVALEQPRATVTALLETLDDGERSRCGELTGQARRRFVVARGALRAALALELSVPAAELQFGAGADGKPQLTSPRDAEIGFNVSHSGELALIALDRGREVGVDVERLRSLRNPAAIAARYFAPEEAEFVSAAAEGERDHLFLRLWTVKEACAKALGRGLDSRTLAGFSVLESAGASLDEGAFEGAWRWRAFDVGGGHVGAVAATGEIGVPAPETLPLSVLGKPRDEEAAADQPART